MTDIVTLEKMVFLYKRRMEQAMTYLKSSQTALDSHKQEIARLKGTISASEELFQKNIDRIISCSYNANHFRSAASHIAMTKVTHHNESAYHNFLLLRATEAMAEAKEDQVVKKDILKKASKKFEKFQKALSKEQTLVAIRSELLEEIASQEGS